MSVENAKTRLLAEYPSEQNGLWVVKGEDPNCDWGGHHHQPTLGTYEGRFVDIVEIALTLPNFFTWGYGGDIKEVKVQKVDPSKVKQLQDARKELSEVTKRKEELEKQIENLGGAS